MDTSELIKEIKKLPTQKRMIVVEKTIQSIRQDEDKIQMEKAAVLLLEDYSTDYELTAFSNIDYEDFYETR